jgi:PASTA domain
MPKVWHLSLEEAEAVVAAAGVAYRVSRAQNPTVPKGELFAVSPSPGTRIGDGQEVILSGSSGPAGRPMRLAPIAGSERVPIMIYEARLLAITNPWKVVSVSSSGALRTVA